jgi:hypothetical protein
MFITNLDTKSSKYYECGKTIGDYLIKSGIPLLSRNDNKMYFSKTRKLQKVLKSMPFYLQALVKVGVING